MINLTTSIFSVGFFCKVRNTPQRTINAKHSKSLLLYGSAPFSETIISSTYICSREAGIENRDTTRVNDFESTVNNHKIYIALAWNMSQLQTDQWIFWRLLVNVHAVFLWFKNLCRDMETNDDQIKLVPKKTKMWNI